MTAPAYGVLRPVTETASVLLENNPSSMTLEGTNSWVLRATPDTPAETASLRLCGIASITYWRMRNTEIRRNSTPEQNTAASPCCQEYL